MHKELTKVFHGEPLSIEMINEEEFYVNVSGIATSYGARITDWSESRRVLLRRAILEEWIDKEEAKKMSREELMVLKDKVDENPLMRDQRLVKPEIFGKYMIHRSLIISFARFLDIEFEIWCDNMIYDLLVGRKNLVIENQTKALRTIEKKYAQQISDLKCEVAKKTQHKLITYEDGTKSLRKWIMDEFPEYEISERDLWKFLAKHQDSFIEVTPATKTFNSITNMSMGKNVGDGISFNDSIIPYIQEFVGEIGLVKKPQQGIFNFDGTEEGQSAN
jgi:hypothetical protein